MVGPNGKDLVGGVPRLGALGYLPTNSHSYKPSMWVQIQEALPVPGSNSESWLVQAQPEALPLLWT